MGKVDIRTALSEGLTEKTDKARGEAESLLEELFGQFNVLEKQQKMVTEALQRYVDGVYADVYDVALHAGAELGDIRGYKMAMEEAEDVAAKMLVTTMINK